MTREMSATERVEAVIRLEKPDRVPVGGWFEAFCAVASGITLAEWVFEPDKAEKAFFDAARMVGGFDVAHRPAPGGRLNYDMAWPTKSRLPGRDLPPNDLWQLEETEMMTVDDYDLIIHEGFPAFQKLYWQRLGLVTDFDEVNKTNQRVVENAVRCRAAGIEPLLANPPMGLPYNFLSFARSLNGFLTDLYRRPEKILAVSDVMIDGAIARAIDSVAGSPFRRVMIGGARAAADFVSPRFAARFYFPYLKKAVNALVEADITPILHLDNDFTPLLHHLLEYPKGKCLLQLDGPTDIFKAKQVLGGHMAIMGDVPATMLTIGTPEEVSAYCRKLIDEVGQDGGFILAAGCTVPQNARMENVRAMIEVAKKYGRYH